MSPKAPLPLRHKQRRLPGRAPLSPVNLFTVLLGGGRGSVTTASAPTALSLRPPHVHLQGLKIFLLGDMVETEGAFAGNSGPSASFATAA